MAIKKVECDYCGLNRPCKRLPNGLWRCRPCANLKEEAKVSPTTTKPGDVGPDHDYGILYAKRWS